MPTNESNSQKKYIGRFAPSPTGPVHFGTLVAALGSCLQARVNDGDWLIRIEDVDTNRTVQGADKLILDTLESFGFEWQGEIIYQTAQTEYYQQALDTLKSRSLLFPCSCSRKQLSNIESDIYPGSCRHRQLPGSRDHAIRILARDVTISYQDAVMGYQSQNIKHQCGDFVIKRKDGLFAYQLAVVVDDSLQGVSEIVRGADLLASTPRQIYLQQLLACNTPAYCHLPLAIDSSGNKISKSAGFARVDIEEKESLLIASLKFLGQKPPAELRDCDIADIWHWAIENWDLTKIPKAEKCKVL